MAWARPRNLQNISHRMTEMNRITSICSSFGPFSIHLRLGAAGHIPSTRRIVANSRGICCRHQWVLQIKVSNCRDKVMWTHLRWISVRTRLTDVSRNVLDAGITVLYLDSGDTRKSVRIAIVDAPSVSSFTNDNALWRHRSVWITFFVLIFTNCKRFIHSVLTVEYCPLSNWGNSIKWPKSQRIRNNGESANEIWYLFLAPPDLAEHEVKSQVCFNSRVNICVCGSGDTRTRYARRCQVCLHRSTFYSIKMFTLFRIHYTHCAAADHRPTRRMMVGYEFQLRILSTKRRGRGWIAWRNSNSICPVNAKRKQNCNCIVAAGEHLRRLRLTR